MLEFMKKAALIGVGLVALTGEKIEEAVKEIVKKGELSEKDGKELVSELVEKSKQVRKEWGERVDKMVTDRLQKLNIPTCKVIDELKERIGKLEQLLEKKEG